MDPKTVLLINQQRKVLTKAQELLLTQECALNVMKKNTKNGKKSGHANLKSAREEAVWEKRGTFTAHCARCHSG
jgi:hypothetical protein